MNLQKLRGLREDNDLTQAQIAELLGTSQTMYARYERGANEMPIRHLVTLCKFYNVSADYLLGLTDIGPAYARRRRKLLSAENQAILHRFESFLLAEQQGKVSV